MLTTFGATFGGRIAQKFFGSFSVTPLS